MKNKIRDIWFIILLLTVFVVMYFIYAQETEPKMLEASLSYLLVSFLGFYVYKNAFTLKSLKIINSFTTLIYMLIGIVGFIIMISISPDLKQYPMESLIFILGFIVTFITLIKMIRIKSLKI